MSKSKFIALLIIPLVLITFTFSLYYLLIAKAQIKAACLEATTRTISRGQYTSGAEINPIVVSDGEEIVFSEDLYRDCVRAL